MRMVERENATHFHSENVFIWSHTLLSSGAGKVPGNLCIETAVLYLHIKRTAYDRRNRSVYGLLLESKQPIR